MKTTKRAWIIRIAAVVILVLVGALMMKIGRGHTVYLDNKPLEYQGVSCTSPYKLTITHKGEQIAKLYEGERGALTNIGDNLELTLEIMETKGGAETTQVYKLTLPHSMDNIIINLPAFMAGLPEEAYLEEFIPVVTDTAGDDEVPDTSEDMGLGDMDM